MNTKLKKHIQEVLKPKPMGVFTENDVISLEISDFIRNQHGTLINIQQYVFCDTFHNLGE